LCHQYSKPTRNDISQILAVDVHIDFERIKVHLEVLDGTMHLAQVDSMLLR
jgi:hypothetical protein